MGNDQKRKLAGLIRLNTNHLQQVLKLCRNVKLVLVIDYTFRFDQGDHLFEGGRPYRILTDVRMLTCSSSSSRSIDLFLRPPSPLPSPHGEGTGIVHLPITQRASCHLRRTTFQETGERFSFSPGEKAGMRASVNTF
jgi:hypothetical protein